MYRTLIVVDNDALYVGDSSVEWMSFETYLRDYPKYDEPKIRIINLCDTEHYLSKGYYCSLLAEARDHRVLPSVKTINDLRALDSDDEFDLFSTHMASIQGYDTPCQVMVYFGYVENTIFQKLATAIFKRYSAPILKINITANKSKLAGVDVNVTRFSFSMLDEQQRALFTERQSEFIRTVWRSGTLQKRFRWDMAILVNPKETSPPSNKAALAHFVKAAAKHSIRAQLLSIDELPNISYYDALFIRETTAIDHYTYRLASKAEDDGLVVLDDPTSILRCCNKVYLHDAFSYQKVPTLKTEVVSDSHTSSLSHLESNFTYPIVLKMPEGSFSKGVFKVRNRQELKQKLDELFQESALILAQEYLYTDFDWRIGVLNGRAIYACRYLMAKNHWQIYNHDAKRFASGNFETLPTFEVPKIVLDAALKATKIIGNGIYGVDIKQHQNCAYVIEVNDNPSLDHKIEDAYLGDELYMQIMSEFQRRLEQRGR